MQTDKKIEEYLERARKIVENITDTRVNQWSEDTKDRLIEIAKMIQLEEHRVPYQDETVRNAFDDWNKRQREKLDNIKRQKNNVL